MLSMESSFDESERILTVKIAGNVEVFKEVTEILSRLEKLFSGIKIDKFWLVSDYSEFGKIQRISFSFIAGKILYRLKKIIGSRTLGRIIVTDGESTLLAYENMLGRFIGSYPRVFKTLDEAYAFVREANRSGNP
jgi:hypothetical protein